MPIMLVLIFVMAPRLTLRNESNFSRPTELNDGKSKILFAKSDTHWQCWGSKLTEKAENQIRGFFAIPFVDKDILTRDYKTVLDAR